MRLPTKIGTGPITKHQALQRYLAYLTLAIAWLVFVPGFSFNALIVVGFLVFGVRLLKSGGFRKPEFVAFGLFIPLVALSIFVHGLSRANRVSIRLTTPSVPACLSKYEVRSGGVIDVPSSPDGQGKSRFAIYWVHASDADVEGLLKQNLTKGRDFESRDSGEMAHVNFDTGESWNLYSGQRYLPKFPALAGSTITPGTGSGWCTLVYRSPNRQIS